MNKSLRSHSLANKMSWFALALLASAFHAPGKTGSWKQYNSGDWSDSTRWDNGLIPSGAGDHACFSNFTAATINQNVAGLALGGLFFRNAPYSITNEAITLDNSGSQPMIEVGTRSALPTTATLAVPLNGADGFSKQGVGRLLLTAPAPGNLSGTVTVEHGSVSSTAVSGAPFGTGSIELKSGELEVMPAGSGQSVSLTAASGDTDSALSYSGVPQINLNKGANTSVTLTLGHDNAEADSVITRSGHGVLIIAPTNGTASANLGAGENLLVKGGVPTHNSMVSASIIGRDCDEAATMDFLDYDAVRGFVRAEYADGVSGGAGSIADIASSTTIGDAAAHALRVRSGVELTIDSGKTLSLGDGARPAGVLLNNIRSQTNTLAGGTIDFGTSEGVILFNGNAGGSAIETIVKSSLAGQSGVTLAGLTPQSEMALNPPGGNSYGGGTRILSGRVAMLANNCFGSGDIHVLGHDHWGGHLYVGFANALITNKLYLSGLVGHRDATNWFGAIRVGQGSGTTFSGPVVLLGDTSVSTTPFTTVATFSGAIEGAGRLEFGGNYPNHYLGTVVLSGANTYSGGTVVRGTVRVDTGGTLGTGPVENRGGLVFNSSATMEITNLLSGAGALVQQGSGTLKLKRAPNYDGALDVNGAVNLCGEDASFGALSGNGKGRIINPAGPALTLTAGSLGSNTVFAGTIEDGISLAKTGGGTLTLFNTNSYSGSTTVSNGTLRLGSDIADIAGLSYRLDASAFSSLTLDNTNVAAWADADGREIAFRQATAIEQPIYVSDAINGLPAISFGFDDTSKRLVADKSALARTVFIVNRMRTGAQGHGIWGRNNEDVGIRARGATAWQHPSNGGNANEFTYQGEIYINGVAGTDFAAGEPHILTAVSSNQVNWTAALGHYLTTQPTRFYRGDIGEALVFESVLSAIERQAVESYLKRKWLDDDSAAPASNLLPTTTSLYIAETGALDLNGVSQTLCSISGVGALRNGSPVACTLTVGGDNSDAFFAGPITGLLSLMKTGAGVWTLAGASSATGAITVAGGTLRIASHFPTNGLSYRLDATERDKLTLDGDNVAEWRDSQGGVLKFIQPTTSEQPLYVANGINGRPSVRFAQVVRNRMYANMAANARSVFIVYNMSSYGGTDGIWGRSGADNGIRATGISSWQRGANASDFTYLGEMFIDGAPANTFTAYQPHVLTAVSSNAVEWITAIGNYWNTSAGLNRYFRGDIGEILVYDRELSAEERGSVETYLHRKWLGSGLTSGLAANAVVEVASGATLDLDGQQTSIAALRGGGAVINGVIAINSETAPGGDNSVGALALPGNPELSGALRIDVREDGASDRLTVDGDLDVSRLALAIVDTGKLNTGFPYTIATCAGTLAGEFVSHNLPGDNWRVSYVRGSGQGKIMLIPQNGMVITIQ